jgi:uncharacterized membrane protein required for colicin V production
MFEPILSIVAILVILSLARLGVLFGVFYELTSTVLLFFAMMVSLRYWYEATRWIESLMPGAGSYGALGAFWALFLVGCLPLILVFNQIGEGSIPRYPKVLDATLGSIFGLVSGTILICCIMMSLSIVAPKVWEPYNRRAFVLNLKFDEFPIRVYRHIEERWLGISKGDPGRTRLPTLEKAQADDFQKYWQPE